MRILGFRIERVKAKAAVIAELARAFEVPAEVLKSADDPYAKAKEIVCQQAAGALARAQFKDAGVPSQFAMNLAQSPYPAYARDNPYQYSVPQSPKRKPNAIVDTNTLKRMADTYDVMRSCINHLKDEVDACPIKIVAKNEDDDSPQTQKRIQEAMQFFTKRGGLGGFGKRRSHFEFMILEDLLVTGAFAIYNHRDRGGRILEAIPIASDTIRPRVDVYGWPGPGEDWYEQWVMGMMVESYAQDELTYDGIYPKTDSPYFSSPVEWLINAVTSALHADSWNRDWLTSGNTASQMLSVPETWSPEMIFAFQDHWNEMMAEGFERIKTKFVPGGFREVSNSRKDQDFQVFEEWLMRRTLSIFSVQPASIGYAGHQYKESQHESHRQTRQFGTGKLLEIRGETYNSILEDNGYEDLELRNVTDEEEDAGARADRLEKKSGWTKINELRAEDGLDSVPDGDVILVPTLVQPLEIAVKPPEPAPTGPAGDPTAETATGNDLKRWQRKAMNLLERGKPAMCTFTSAEIDDSTRADIEFKLQRAVTVDQVREAFVPIESKSRVAMSWRSKFLG